MRSLSENRPLKPLGFASLKGLRRLCLVTAYDFPSAFLAERVGIDAILVGDSAAMVLLGYKDTIPITIDEMLIFSKAVTRAATNTLVIADMPFLSYQSSSESAIVNAGRFLKESGVGAIKIEGGTEYAPLVKKMVESGIPVMGHIGLLPQSAALSRGFNKQGKTVNDAEKIFRDAEALEKAGAFSIVMEMVPREVSRLVTEHVKIPTIGIGSGPKCDGQILVWHDLLGLGEKQMRFVKRYVNLRDQIVNALTNYKDEVKEGEFPADKNSFNMNNAEFKKFMKRIS